MKSGEERETRRWPSLVALSLVGLAYLLAVVNMVQTRREQDWGDRKVIRMTHWQLESGFREGMERMIQKFEAQNPDVKIIQNPIYEKAYAQFVNTNLVGGTAPDLIEMGMFDVGATLGRYFLPLTRYVHQPNEFNAGNKFKDTPWIYTFVDGLAGNWDDRYLEYFAVGLNLHTVRMFYNKDLYREIMGHDRPPATFRELLDVCRRAEEYAVQKGITLHPIACSSYQAGIFRGVFSGCLLSSLIDRLDRDWNHALALRERFVGYLEGRMPLDDEEIRAGEELVRELSRFYTPGFMATRREDAGFDFVQRRSLIITSGSWDAGSYRSQARDAGFEMGVLDFPIPSADDPVYGRFLDGRASEAGIGVGSNFGICRDSRHPDVALRFLKFITTPENNEEFNHIVKWLPSIRGADVDELVRPFAPNIEGVPQFKQPFSFGYRTLTRENQSYWEYISGRTSYEKFTAQVGERLIEDGMADYMDDLQGQLDNLRGIEHLRSALAVPLLDPDKTNEEANFKLVYSLDSAMAVAGEIRVAIRELADPARFPKEKARELQASSAYRDFTTKYLAPR